MDEPLLAPWAGVTGEFSGSRVKRPLWEPVRISRISALGQAVTVHVTKYIWAGVCHCVSD